MIDSIHFDSFPNLESDRLVFRKFELSDAENIFEIRSNKKVMQFMDSDLHKSVEVSNQFIHQNLNLYKNKSGIFWAIINKKSNEFIGDFSFWKIDHKNSRGEIGYSLNPEYWGNGYMSETIGTIIDFGFNQLKLHSIEANINPKNDKSKKLLLKSGFIKEAYFRENYYHNGKYLDSEIYSLLKLKQQ